MLINIGKQELTRIRLDRRVMQGRVCSTAERNDPVTRFGDAVIAAPVGPAYQIPRCPADGVTGPDTRVLGRRNPAPGQRSTRCRFAAAAGGTRGATGSSCWNRSDRSLRATRPALRRKPLAGSARAAVDHRAAIRCVRLGESFLDSGGRRRCEFDWELTAIGVAGRHASSASASRTIPGTEGDNGLLPRHR
jgi:hypothetical protein